MRPSQVLRILTAAICLLLLTPKRAEAVDGLEPSYTPMTGDLKFIRCSVCEELASALHDRVAAVKAANQATRQKLTETMVGEVSHSARGRRCSLGVAR